MVTVFKRNTAQFVRNITDAILKFNPNLNFGDELGDPEVPITTIHDAKSFTVLEPRRRLTIPRIPKWLTDNLPLYEPRRVIIKVDLLYTYENDEIPREINITIFGEDLNSGGNQIATVIAALNYADEINIEVKGEQKFEYVR